MSLGDVIHVHHDLYLQGRLIGFFLSMPDISDEVTGGESDAETDTALLQDQIQCLIGSLHKSNSGCVSASDGYQNKE